MPMRSAFVKVDRLIRGAANPRDRAALERWLVEFVAENPQFTVEQAVMIVVKLMERWGTVGAATYVPTYNLAHLEVRSTLDWSLRGSTVNDQARPIQLASPRGGTLEVFTACDVTPPVVGDIFTVTVEPPVPAIVHGASDALRANVPSSAVAYLSRLEAVGIELNFIDDASADFAVDTAPGETGGHGLPRSCAITVNTAVDESVVFNILLALARLVYGGIFENVEQVDVHDATVHPLELSLMTYCVSRRLGLVTRDRAMAEDHWIDDFLELFPNQPVTSCVHWSLIGMATAALEDVLSGQFETALIDDY